MKFVYLILPLIFSFLSACNFEKGEESAGSSLISEHKKTTNKISLTGPSAGLYAENDYLEISVSHPFPLIVTGTPSIAIDIDGTVVDADYFAGSGQKTIKFRYQVSAGDFSSSGINIPGPSIDLNGGSIQFDNKGVMTNADTTISNLNASSVIVDAQAASIQSILSPLAGSYFENQNLNFALNFDEKVYVTGAPRLALNIGGSPVYAQYISGSGSNNLIFRKVVLASEDDGDGIDILDPIDLNGGSIKDIAGNSASLAFADTHLNTVLVSGNTPYVTTITPPPNDEYVPGDQFEISLKFNKTISVTGTPQIPLDIGGDILNALYISGSGSDTLVFRAPLVSGYEDEDGIEIAPLIDLNGGTIQAAGPINAHLQTYAPLTPGIIVNAPLPRVTSIELPTVPADGYFNLGEEMYFTLRFNNEVTVSAIPEMQMTLDSTSPALSSVAYNSGSVGSNLVMRYVVQATDEDHTGIDLASMILLNGGTIQNANGTNADLNIQDAIDALDLTTIKVDAIPPEVVAATASPAATYGIGDAVNITLEFREIVTVTGSPRLTLNVGGTNRQAIYQGGSGSAFLNFRYTVGNGHEDTDGLLFTNTLINLNGGEIQDLGGNNAVLDFSAFAPDLSSIIIDGIRPEMTNITIAANTYTQGQTISASVQFSEDVNVTGAPSMALTFTETSGAPELTYQSGSGSNTLIFTYTVQAQDEDLDGITLAATITNSATIEDLNGNASIATVTSTNFPTVLVDALAPTISLLTPADNSFVNIANNSPNFALTGSCDDDSATYDILINGASAAGQAISCASPNLTGTFDSTAIGEGSFTLSVEALDSSGNTSLSNSHTITKDTVAPQVTNVANPANANYTYGNPMNFVATFDESVSVTSGDIILQTNFGNLQASFVPSGASATHTFRYTVTEADYDNDGIGLQASIANATIEDAAGNPVNINFAPNDSSNIFINNGTPAFNWKDLATSAIPIVSFDYNFQVVNVGVLFTITNIGDAPTTTLNVQMTDMGAGNSFQLISHDCPNILAINATCSANVEFQMGAPAGYVTGEAQVIDNGHALTPFANLALEGDK